MSETYDRLHGLATYHGAEKMVLIISPMARDEMTNAERMYLRRVAEENDIEIRVDCILPKDTAILMNESYYKSITVEVEQWPDTEHRDEGTSIISLQKSTTRS